MKFDTQLPHFVHHSRLEDWFKDVPFVPFNVDLKYTAVLFHRLVEGPVAGCEFQTNKQEIKLFKYKDISDLICVNMINLISLCHHDKRGIGRQVLVEVQHGPK